MGCGTSHTSLSLRPRLVIVGPNKGPEPCALDTYRLPGCVPQHCVELPLRPGSQQDRLHCGFSVTSHPSRPLLYLAGGVYVNQEEDSSPGSPSSHVWCLRLDKESWVSEQVCKHPLLSTEHKSCVKVHQGKAAWCCVSIDGTVCLSLDLHTNEWTHYPQTPFGSVDYIFVVKNKLCVAGEGKLAYLSSHGNWKTVVKDDFPFGLMTVVGDAIYVYDQNMNEVFQCCPLKGNLTRLEGLDYSVIKGSMSMVGIGDSYLYFTGGSGSSSEVTTVVEHNLRYKQTAVAGYLYNCIRPHKALICLA